MFRFRVKEVFFRMGDFKYIKKFVKFLIILNIFFKYRYILFDRLVL